MAGSENPHAGTRDFIMFALMGAVSAYLAELFGNSWLILAGFSGALSLLLSGYWIDRGRDSGITTEVAAILTFFLGVLIVRDAIEVAIALAIVVLAILSQKKAIETMTSKIKIFELQAAIKFLVITFIILPVLPNQPLSEYLTVSMGIVQSYESSSSSLTIDLEKNVRVESGAVLALQDKYGTRIGNFTITAVKIGKAVGKISLSEDGIIPAKGQYIKHTIDIGWLDTMLGALNPYKIWLIVVLVSTVSLVGYVAVKILGPGAGTGLTGLIGGLASSTVTTVSFARRSLETPELSRSFGVAILLASSIMFPRLLLEIAVVNQDLMKNMALPIMVMGGTGIVLAFIFSLQTKKDLPAERVAMQIENPFCLKSAITFGLVFSVILMLTRLATSYLGDRWLPLVALASGLVDADAIAFSLSDAQKAGIISLDWASFNLVLGALSNTVVKLFFVYTMGHRKLFRQLFLSFLVVSVVGIATTLIYYKLW